MPIARSLAAAKTQQRAVPAAHAITQYVHCGQCLAELKAAGFPQSPRAYARLEVGFTAIGLQVWCVRHRINVAHIDFEDQRHPANLAARDEAVL